MCLFAKLEFTCLAEYTELTSSQFPKHDILHLYNKLSMDDSSLVPLLSLWQVVGLHQALLPAHYIPKDFTSRQREHV